MTNRCDTPACKRRARHHWRTWLLCRRCIRRAEPAHECPAEGRCTQAGGDAPLRERSAA